MTHEWTRTLVIGAAALTLAACGETRRAHDFDSVDSPGGAVLTVTVVEPWFPQGPHQVVIYVQPEREAPRVEVARTTLAYDGVPFTHANINMTWIGADQAIVCLRATDRPDKSVHVDAHRRPPTGELRDGC